AGAGGESKRRVWLARSTDDGKSFSRESAVSPESGGACGCCGLKALADHQGNVYLLYRTAKQGLHRDMTLMSSDSKGAKFKILKVEGWELPGCPMTTSNMYSLDRGVLGAWETKGKIQFSRFSPEGARGPSFRPPDEGINSKHPSLAQNASGEILMAWTEATAWQKGGTLAWQVFDKEGRPTAAKGRLEGGIPVWSFPAAASTTEGFQI